MQLGRRLPRLKHLTPFTLWIVLSFVFLLGGKLDTEETRSARPFLAADQSARKH